MIAGYREGRYTGLRKLPPKVDSSRCYGKLAVELGVPRWTNRVGQHIRVKIRFWGEDDPLLLPIPVDQAVSCEYEVMVQANKLISYLADMKILKIEFEDARNSKIVAVGLLNLQMYLLEKDALDLDTTVQIHSIKDRVKHGEVDVKLRLDSIGNTSGTNISKPDNVQSTQKKNVGEQTDSRNIRLQSQNESKGTSKIADTGQPLQPAIQERTNYQPNSVKPDNPPTLQDNNRKTSGQQLIDHHLVQLLNQHCCQVTRRIQSHNFEAEVERLRLEELELLHSKLLVDHSKSGLLGIQIDRCERLAGKLSGNTDYRMTIEFPIMVGDALKVNLFDLACTSSDAHQAVFEQQIQVNTIDAETDEGKMRRYLGEQAKFNFMERYANGECKIIGQGLARLSALVSRLRSTGSLVVPLSRPVTNKKDARAVVQYNLFLKTENAEYRPIPEQNINPNQTKKPEFPAKGTQQLVERSEFSGMLMVNVGKYHNLRPTLFRDNNYMLRLKLAANTFVSATSWNETSPNFQFSSTLSLSRELAGMIIEVWNKGTNGSLIGVSKLDLKYDLLWEQCKKNESSLYPSVVYEDELPVGSLQGQMVGYLQTSVMIGSNQQINRHMRAHSSKVDKQNKSSIQPPKPSELYQEETNITRPQDPAVPRKTDPNSAKGQVTQPEEPQPQSAPTEPSHPREDQSKLVDILGALFNHISQEQTRSGLLRLLDGKTNISASELRDILKVSLKLNMDEWKVGKLCYFLVDDLRVQVPQLISSLESYQLYTAVLLQEYTGVVSDLRYTMQQKSLTTNTLEATLAGKANCNTVSRSNFRHVIRQLLPTFEAVNLELLLKFCSRSDQVEYGEFCDMLRRFQVQERVSRVAVDPSLLMELVGGELADILMASQDTIHQLLRMEISRPIDYKQLMRLLQKVGVLVSYWEALNVVEYIKRELVEDSQVEGQLTGKTLRKWFGSLVAEPETRMIRSPTFGDNLFQPGLRDVEEQSEHRSLLPVIVSLNEQSVSNNQPVDLPSPINLPPLEMHLNFTIGIEHIIVNGKEVQFRARSSRLLILQCRKQPYYSIELVTSRGQEYEIEGVHDQWIAVTDADANYIGALRIS